MTGKVDRRRRKAPSARIQGEPLDDRFGPEGGLIDLLQAAAEPGGGRGLVFVRTDGGETFVPYTELFEQARARLAGLRRLGLVEGDTAVLCHADSAAFVHTFWACVLGGIVPAATAYPTAFRAGNKELGKLADIAAQIGGPPVLTDATLCDRLPQITTEAEYEVLHPVDCAHLDDADAAPELTPGRGDDLALIQYSSGSTGRPKGVMITHRNVLANMEGMVRGFEIGPDDIFGAWLPYHHDFGLMCFHILPVAARVTQVNLAPPTFLRRPALWLQKIQDHRVSVTGAPNFGYMHTLRSVGDARCSEYDLASVRLIINGAEPISVATMQRFMDAVAPAGVPRAAMTPGYGMAEATLTATITPPGETPLVRTCDRVAMVTENRAVECDDGARTTRIVDEGYPLPGMEVRIVGDGGGQVREGRVGHIQLSGPHVTTGYLRNAVATDEARAGRWLRTGDLGFIRDGRLSITGRAKDVIFVNGENHFAHDLEAAAESVAGVVAGSAAACGWHDEDAGRECTVLFAKVKNPPEGSSEHDVLRRAWARVSEDCGVVLDHVVPGVNVPRTTSGKAQRFQLLQRFRAREFDDVVIPRARFDGTADEGIDDREVTDTEARIRAIWAGILGIPAERIDPESGFRTLGGSSVQAVQILAGLERTFGRTLDYDLLLQCSSVREMARYLDVASEVTIGTVDGDDADAAPLDIAVIGVAGRFPGADGVEAFWDNLMQGVESVGEVPAGRWPLAPYWSSTPTEPGKTCSCWGGFLTDAYRFDAALFGIEAEEAEVMDPQQRHFMEITWRLLEQAGHLRRRAGRTTGVFVGASHNPYMEHHRHALDLEDLRDLPTFRELPPEQAERLEREWCERFGVMDMHPNTAVDNLLNMIAARTSSALDLKGPSLAVDTACSSSLVAVHLAIESLQRGECGLAVAGGVNIMSSPTPWQLLSRSGALSPTGRSRTFDTDADGLVPGEGVGAVLLKPLAQAVADGDPVEAVIRATSMNNDGSALGPMAPNPDGQRSVIERTYRRYGIDPASVDYVEAHGTGTPIGDPSEVRALSQAWKALGVDTGERPVGSVKANIGHLLSAAGIASLIKVIGAMRRGVMPPSVALEQCAPEISFETTPFAPITDATSWPSTSGLRRAAVSSFGFGGTNCHMVVDGGAVTIESTPAVTPSAHLLCCSAHTEGALRRRLQDLAGALSRGELEPATAAAALRRRDPGLAYRAAAVVTGADDAERLTAAQVVRTGRPGGVVLMCTGQGAQYPGMTRSLAANAPGFRRHLEDCAAAFAGRIDIDLLELLFGEASDRAMLARTRYTQPVVFAVDYAVGRWLLDSGIEPDLVMGHSIGELAAACLAGVFSLTDAARIVAARARLMDDLPDEGGMLAVFDNRAAVETALARWSQRLWLAACNASHVVVAGETDALEEYLAELQATGGSARRLDVSNAFHTPLMEPMLEDFGAEFEQVELHTPRWPLLSNETGEVAGDEIATPAYWQRQVVSPVRFEQSLTTAIARGADVFVEAGPDRTLSPLVRSVAGGAACVAVSALCRRADDWQSLMACWKTLFEAGVTPASRGFDVDQGRDPRGLPDYPLERCEYRPEQRFPRTETEHPSPGEDVRAARLHGWYWREIGAPPTQSWSTESAVILVNRGALAEQVIAELRLHIQPIYVVEAGDAWVRNSPFHFCIEPTAPDDYERLLETIGDPGLWIDLRHCDASGGGPIPDASGMHALAVALGRRPVRPARLLLVSENAMFDTSTASRRPGRAPIDAVFADAIAETWSEIEVGVLELDCTAPARERARRIVSELGSARLEPMVAWHGDKRLVRELRSLADEAPVGMPDLEDGDTVLITGGLGGVGREVVRHLAGQARLRLVLVGRRELDAEAHALLAELTAAGADAVYRRADVTDETAMASVIEDTQARFGSVTGVIHAAGTADAERLALADKTSASIAAVLAPKTKGTAVLDRLTRAQPLRWFISFGSVAATYPRLGARFLADYAAANAWLDAYTRWRAGTDAPGRSLTIHWSVWDDLGLGRQAGIDALARASGLVPLSREQGLASFDRLLARAGEALSEPVVHVFDQRPSAQPKVVAYATATPPSASVAEPKPEPVTAPPKGAGTSPAPAAASYVDLIREQVATELGVAIGDIAPAENFLEQGLSSADAARVLAALADRLDVKLYPTLLFEFQTADALGEYLEQTYGPFARAEMAGAGGEFRDVGVAAGAGSPEPDISGAGDDDIAIVGMGCRTAGAEDLYAFRELVFSGRTALSDVPPERWDPATHCDRDGRSGKTYVARGGFLDSPFDFDPMFFGLSPRTAEAMDPQQRVFLEVAWHTLQHAGYGGDHRPGRTGVFVGCEQNQYLQHFANGIRFDTCRDALSREPALQGLAPQAREACLCAIEQAFRPAGLSSDVVPGNGLNQIAARISHWLDLSGPALAVNTACSSGVTALHTACQSLRAGDCDAALVGAVHVNVGVDTFVLLSEMQALSPDGDCRPFDADANGMVLGEGAGAVLLKPLSAARRDGDRVHAVIRGSAVNNDGRSQGLTAPNPAGQADAITRAYRTAAVDPETVDYIEAHGTGTVLGDPIEIEGLRRGFKPFTERQRFCTLASLKAVVGHTLAASSILGVIRGALAFEEERVPPTPGYRTLNPHIDLDTSPAVPGGVASEPLRPGERPRRVGVSAFGFGGTNGHVVLEEGPAAARMTEPADRAHLMCLSGRTEEQLASIACELRDRLDALGDGAVAALCASQTLATRRMHQRVSLVVRSAEELRRLLAHIADGKEPGGVGTGASNPTRRVESSVHIGRPAAVSTQTAARLAHRFPVWGAAYEAAGGIGGGEASRAFAAAWATATFLAAVGLEPARISATDDALAACLTGEITVAAARRRLGLGEAEMAESDPPFPRAQRQQDAAAEPHIVFVAGSVETPEPWPDLAAADPEVALLDALAGVFRAGLAFDARPLIPAGVGRVDVPLHPFEHQTFRPPAPPRVNGIDDVGAATGPVTASAPPPEDGADSAARRGSVLADRVRLALSQSPTFG